MFKKFFGKLKEAREEKAARKEEEYFKRTSNKYYQPEDEGKPKFADDYFKSTDNDATRRKRDEELNSQRQANGQYQTRRQPQEPVGEKPRQQAEGKKETDEQREARRTEMSNGVVIIDDRDTAQARRKIFAPEEGEYADFVEVN